MLSLSDLVRVPTKDEVKQTTLNLLASFGFPVTSWQSGGAGRVLSELTGSLFTQLPLSVQQLAQSAFIESSSGDWLTLVAWQWYRIERLPNAITVGTLKLTNSTGSPITKQAEDLIARASTGALYRNTSTVTIPANSYITTEFQAEAPGYSYNVPATTINDLATPVPGLTVSSPAVGTTGTWITTLGADTESDESLRTRCKARWAELSYGPPVLAYEKWVREASNQVTKVTVDTPGYYGIVRIRLAGPLGAVSSGVVTAVSDYIDGVTDGKRRRALNATLDIASASGLTVPVTGVVTVKAKSKSKAEAQIVSNLVSMFANLPIGGEVIRHEIVEQIMGGEGVKDVSLTTPSVNVGLSPSQVAVLSYALTYNTY